MMRGIVFCEGLRILGLCGVLCPEGQRDAKASKFASTSY